MKRIILCADGTWNEPEQVDEKTGRRRPTNVLKSARAVQPRAADGTEQVVYYLVGIGGESAGLDKVTDGAFGNGMERNVRSLYRFIVFNYRPGDEIYLFGFSRGAFTVRTLCGFMHAVGLLEKQDEFFTPDLYKLYESSTPKGAPEWQHAFRHIKQVRPCPAIRFVGVWDTVGSLGPPGALGQIFNPNKYKYHDTGLNEHIANAFHALAIDEQRGPFAPTLFKRPDGWPGTLQQAWFPGYHCNVGGSSDPDGVANEALHWMIEKAGHLGMEFDKGYLAHYTACFNSKVHDSMSTMYKLMRKYLRPIGDNLAHGEAIHQSALDRMKLAECDYHPGNLEAAVARGNVPVVSTQGRTGKPCGPLPAQGAPAPGPATSPFPN
ncbi:MAG TPA: DUF2235 domain-containing protein [Burkholderiales bacterium]|nr:DUF2235 domain-containing protein [Burkholderiales bacterium]